MADQLQNIDIELWEECFTQESRSPPPFLPADIEPLLHDFLKYFLGMTKNENIS